ncbi:BZ3500_MvSof-1268-A1-R1_Chr9g10649 [Microbotryum saponariae]|uniref:Transmembrane 9 superfamily member n=1 Tax=Microbotryum saponariae TaxID=289078 RepID=A0A2X0L2Y0_9BASI|nr:BZ3501_MvSof-1269-A2-R1_Chr9g10397 [Microbotryum saponariae]SDA00452.1 BZ3500_MvSof-1268-A1-R1_Chr9g10649 [Microbotryum saponariae]
MPSTARQRGTTTTPHASSLSRRRPRSWPSTSSLLLLTSLYATATLAFYLPGAAPKDYLPGDRVPLLVNALKPHASGWNAQVKSMVAYDYYDPQFGFCQPKPGPPKKQAESLGSVLFGDRLYDSPFNVRPWSGAEHLFPLKRTDIVIIVCRQIRMLEDATCVHLCTSTLSAENSAFLADRIAENYAYSWLIDGLPAAEMKQDTRTKELFYSAGFSLGSVDGTTSEAPEAEADPNVVFKPSNHFDIYLEYHSRTDGHKRVVGVVVWPSSRDSLAGTASTPSCATSTPFPLDPTKPNKIAYTYSIIWKESATPWSTRWDHYLRVSNPRIHVLSLASSIIIAGFLCGMVAMVLLRTVHGDISRYNAIDLDEDVQEDFGWKLVHGEVFRPPKRRMLLSVVVGSVFAHLGFLSPSNRGSLSTVMIITFSFFGGLTSQCIAGYVSSRVYASLKGEEWRKTILLTTVLFPTVLFVFLHLLNFFLLGAGSSGAVPFGTFMAIVGLWFGVNVPTAAVGGYLGVRHGAVDHPVRINQIPRQIPRTEWWLAPWPSAILAGILPFVSQNKSGNILTAAGFIELYAVMQSLFGSKVYYAFGFLALTSLIVLLTVATSAVLVTYFALCSEEYRWHWRSVLAGGGAGLWLFGYGILYWVSRLHLDGLANKVLYLGYLVLLSGLVFLVLGTTGFVSSYWFLKTI